MDFLGGVLDLLHGVAVALEKNRADMVGQLLVGGLAVKLAWLGGLVALEGAVHGRAGDGEDFGEVGDRELTGAGHPRQFALLPGGQFRLFTGEDLQRNRNARLALSVQVSRALREFGYCSLGATELPDTVPDLSGDTRARVRRGPAGRLAWCSAP